MMKGIVKVVDRVLCEMEKGVVAFGIMFLAFAVFLSVCTRAFIGWAWIGTEELAKFLVIWITFWGTSWGVREGRHIVMTALLELAPERIVKIFITIISLITGLFCFAVAILGWKFTQLAFTGGQVSPALLVPIWPVYVSVPIGLFLTGIQYMRIFFENLFGQK